MVERRFVARKRTYLKGVLSFNNGNSSEDCLVRDLTESGAQIESPHPVAPEVCDLLIPSRGIRARTRAVWRSGARRGLHFEPAQEDKPARKPAKADEDSY